MWITVFCSYLHFTVPSFLKPGLYIFLTHFPEANMFCFFIVRVTEGIKSYRLFSCWQRSNGHKPFYLLAPILLVCPSQKQKIDKMNPPANCILTCPERNMVGVGVGVVYRFICSCVLVSMWVCQVGGEHGLLPVLWFVHACVYTLYHWQDTDGWKISLHFLHQPKSLGILLSLAGPASWSTRILGCHCDHF